MKRNLTLRRTGGSEDIETDGRNYERSYPDIFQKQQFMIINNREDFVALLL